MVYCAGEVPVPEPGGTGKGLELESRNRQKSGIRNRFQKYTLNDGWKKKWSKDESREKKSEASKKDRVEIQKAVP